MFHFYMYRQFVDNSISCFIILVWRLCLLVISNSFSLHRPQLTHLPHAGPTRIWTLKPADPPRLWKTQTENTASIISQSAFLPPNHVKMQEMLFQRPYFSKFWDVSCLRRSAPPVVINDPSGWPALLSLKLEVCELRVLHK